MTSMTETDRYNGYANRETWAFNLHWQNDQGLYRETLERAGEWLAEVHPDWWDAETMATRLGEHIVSYWRETIDEWEDETGTPLLEALKMFRDEVGSWWRVDNAEVGEAVRESLGAES